MITAPLIHSFKKVFFTLLAVLVSAFLFVILLTYTPNDPSWSRISSDMGQISNMGGAIGAWLSDLLYTFLGWSAWWLIVFLAYEAMSIWWKRNQAIGPLRVIGYVFLLLSSCALVAIVPQLFGIFEVSNARSGGILGAEVASQLTGLLTIYGASTFLLVFVLLTATFVFDVHWRQVFVSLVNLSWLGTGVRDKKTKSSQQQLTDAQVGDASVNDAIKDNAQVMESSSEQRQRDEDTDSEQSPLFQQLKLNLDRQQAQQEVSVENAEQTQAKNPAWNNALDEFLVTSGLTETILTLREQRKQEAQAQREQRARGSMQSQQASEEQLTVKQEPSFAWNDPDVIDELLYEPSSSQQSQPLTTLEQANIESAQPLDSIQQVVAPEQVVNSDTGSNKAGQAEDITETKEYKPSLESKLEPSDTMFNDTMFNDTMSSDTDTMVDLTPTNTPPANPREPHKLEDKPTTAQPATPIIRFATPEGDANHIEDMVPEEDVEEVTLPEIHDDTAFTTSSRAMQTAKYRESLTPIPELSILDKPDPDRKPSYTQEELTQLSELLEIKLQEFNVKAEVVNAIPGPVVTRFEVDLAAGVKASKVTGISRDLARSLSMASLRVVEVIPGKPYIGIEVPNKKREMVRLIELLETADYKDPKAQISMAMGKDIGGKPIITDLARAPHMLVAGTTGSGKSVLVNAMLLSMLLKYKPADLRLILIDPKQLELANYNDIPHLLTPVVTDMNEAASSLSWCVAEMERRYQLMSLLKVRKLKEFNKKVVAAEKAGHPILDPLWRPNDSVSIDKAPKLKTLPMIVIVADEFADMIMQVGKQAEELITRLAQKSRAAGIHLMLATQRPSVDVITGLIKANIPVRAALRVNSKVDSRTILDAGGAEDMLGNGDMLFLGPGQIEPERVHGAYVSDEEVNRVCDAWRERGAPDYIDNMASNFELTSPSGAGNTSGEDDALYDEAVAFVLETRKVSASSIQRKFSIGYNRAARIVDSMEEAGLVSPMGKSGKRELLM
ncbi:DNA translocase FtsK [Psychrobacter lutiphocae]|uniref:DNA translocase FtsK n=1 Tax=Psychrobacter lutiphocae TaxID=540500 RepID=UPI000372D88C|nr:DNA translocase FtsK [Psychrobacter lutiphocae]